MRTGIVYLLTGEAHAARAVVSLWNLRKHYKGNVTLFTTRDESWEIGEACRRDDRLAVEHERYDELMEVPRKNRQFLTKIHLLMHAPYDVTLYLDCDTLPVGDPLPLINQAFNSRFCATQFNHWVTSGRTIKRRLERWRQFEDRVPGLNKTIDWLITHEYPSVNGGIIAARRDSGLLREWFELAKVGWKTFICDEVALHFVIARRLPMQHVGRHVMLGGRYNCSPYLAHDETRENAVIHHFHGEKHLSQDVKKAWCKRIWWPAYQEVIAENVAGIRDWTPAGDWRLQKQLDAAQRKRR